MLRLDGNLQKTAILPNSYLSVFLYLGKNVGWNTVHGCEQLLQRQLICASSMVICLCSCIFKIPLLLSRCQQGKIFTCVRCQNCFFNKKHSSFRLLHRLDLSSCGNGFRDTWKIDNFCTHCSLFQRTQRTGHILVCLLIATEQRKDMDLVAGRYSLAAFSLRIYLSENKHQDQFLQLHFKGWLDIYSCPQILCMHNILRHIIYIHFSGS